MKIHDNILNIDITYFDFISKYKNNYNNISKISIEDFANMMNNTIEDIIEQFDSDLRHLYLNLETLCSSRRYHYHEEYVRECEKLQDEQVYFKIRYFDLISCTYIKIYNRVHKILVKYKNKINKKYANTIVGETNKEIYDSICNNLFEEYLKKEIK